MCGEDTKNSDKSSGSVTGRVDPSRVLRGAGGHGRGARGSGSRVGNHRVRRSWSAEGGRAGRAVTTWMEWARR